jgi:hypothetical protein
MTPTTSSFLAAQPDTGSSDGLQSTVCLLLQQKYPQGALWNEVYRFPEQAAGSARLITTIRLTVDNNWW